MVAPEITALQTEHARLWAEGNVLSPRLKPLQDSAEQDALAAKMALLQKRQREISALLADVLDGELEEQRVSLDKRYIDEMAALPGVGFGELDDACKRIANINKERIALYGERRRCARIAGREKVAFPMHVGIVHAGDICDPEKIKASFVGYGEPAGRGRGMRTSRGGLG